MYVVQDCCCVRGVKLLGMCCCGKIINVGVEKVSLFYHTIPSGIFLKHQCYFTGVFHGGWNCWSAWGSCSQGQKSRTRACNNPVPKNGGKHCVGPSIEHKTCEDPDLEHLRYDAEKHDIVV